VRRGRAADHSPPSSTEVLDTSTPLWATTGPVTGLLYLFLLLLLLFLMQYKYKRLTSIVFDMFHSDETGNFTIQTLQLLT